MLKATWKRKKECLLPVCETCRVLAARSALLHCKAKDEGCRVRIQLRAMEREGVNVSGWPSHMEIERGNKVTNMSDERGCEIEEQKRVGEAFHGHFTQLFGRSKNLNRRQAQWVFLIGGTLGARGGNL